MHCFSPGDFGVWLSNVISMYVVSVEIEGGRSLCVADLMRRAPMDSTEDSEFQSLAPAGSSSLISAVDLSSSQHLLNMGRQVKRFRKASQIK
jgi:hypothetical protein